MSHYSDDESSVRVDFFRESGKWYATEAVSFKGLDWRDHFWDTIYEALNRHLGERYSDMTAVILHPFHQCEHPVMLKHGEWRSHSKPCAHQWDDSSMGIFCKLCGVTDQ